MNKHYEKTSSGAPFAAFVPFEFFRVPIFGVPSFLLTAQCNFADPYAITFIRTA
jgi:hypothetical protein